MNINAMSSERRNNEIKLKGMFIFVCDETGSFQLEVKEVKIFLEIRFENGISIVLEMPIEACMLSLVKSSRKLVLQTRKLYKYRECLKNLNRQSLK